MALHIAAMPGLEDFAAAGDIEQKYVFRAMDRGRIQDWLEFHLARDPQFYYGPILSLYYDTPALQFYREARNGDYLKTKVRLRWYQNHWERRDQPVACFLEIKRKYGSLRHKQRQALSLPATSLSGDLFGRPEVANLAAALASFGCFNRAILVPVLVVDYQRYRYLDARSGARLALDFAIGCDRVNASYLAGAAPIESDVGVLEIKGKDAELPNCLRPLRRYLRRRSFSKYALCCQRVLDPWAWRAA